MSDIYKGTYSSKRHIGYLRDGYLYLDAWISDTKAARCTGGVISIEWLMKDEIIAWYDEEYLYMMRGNRKEKVAKVENIFIRDYATNQAIGEYKGIKSGALAIPFYYDFEEKEGKEFLRQNKPQEPSREETSTSKRNSGLTSSIITILMIGFIIFLVIFSFETWGSSIQSGLHDFNWESLSKKDQNDLICTGILFVGAIAVGIAYVMKNRKRDDNSLLDHMGEAYRWLRWLIVPIEIINFLLTKSIMGLIFVPFVCFLVLIAPSILFGAITWLLSKFS